MGTCPRINGPRAESSIGALLGLVKDVGQGVEDTLDHHDGSVVKSVTHGWSEKFDAWNLRRTGRSGDYEFNVCDLTVLCETSLIAEHSMNFNIRRSYCSPWV
jgi:hypothetical protein